MEDNITLCLNQKRPCSISDSDTMIKKHKVQETDLEKVIKQSRDHASYIDAVAKIHKQRIDSLLDTHGLTRINVPADGNCFFQAIVNEVGGDATVQSMRYAVCDFLNAHKDDYEKQTASKNYQEEVQSLRNNGIWSSDLADIVPYAVASAVQRPIRIYTSLVTLPIIDVPTDTNMNTRPPIHIAYLAIKGSEHYDNCQPGNSSLDHIIEPTSTIPVPADAEPLTASTSSRPTSPSMKQRKRKSDKTLWKRNERKSSKLQGNAYRNGAGKYIKERKVAPSNCRCKYSCTKTFSETERHKLFNTYYSLDSYQRQRDFICSNVKQTNTQDGKRKKNCRKYNFHSKQVCKDFFLSTLNIGSKTIEYSLKNEYAGSFVGSDKRGKHAAHNKTPGHKVEEVRQHIKSFPAVESHYQRQSTQKRFLGADLNITKMHDLYAKATPNSVTLGVYRTIFNNDFNLGFHKPKKDACMKCSIYDHSKKSGKCTEEIQNMHAQHMRRKEHARELKDANKLAAQDNSSVYAATFDMQAVLTTPCSNVSKMYYARKLASYNLSVYSLSDKVGTCYVWDETEGKRGSNDIGTCLIRHLQNLPPHVTDVKLHSDSCPGQNRNKFIASALLYSVQQSPNLKTIELSFLETGHTQMECDSIHSSVEYVKKHTSVYIPLEWQNLIRLARRNKPYVVVPLQYTDFIDVKALCASYNMNWTVDEDGKRVNWLYVRTIVVEHDNPNIRIQTEYGGEIRTLTEKRKAKRSQTDCGRVLTHPYKEKLPISKAKKNDIMTLCKDGIIPVHYHAFYEGLSTSATQRDCLASPDMSEDDSDTDTE